jgi:hypothetical protein
MVSYNSDCNTRRGLYTLQPPIDRAKDHRRDRSESYETKTKTTQEGFSNVVAYTEIFRRK